MNYQIVCFSNRTMVMEEVEKLIQEGWTPLGGVSTSWLGHDSAFFFSQALVKLPGA